MNRLICSLGLAGSLLIPTVATANAVPGEPAPAFRATDAAGHPHTLTDYIGGWVILEWFHPDCEATTSLYESGEIQVLQEEFREKDVKWLTIVSSKPGPRDLLEAEDALELAQTYESAASAPFLLDDTSVVALAYGVEKAPQLFVIDPRGELVYAGALNNPDSSADSSSNSSASDNYVSAALKAAMNGEEVEVPHTQPHGCDVEY